MLAIDDIVGVLVRIVRPGEADFFLLAGADGSITRSEQEDDDDPKPLMLVGTADPAVFASIRRLVSAPVLQWLGRQYGAQFPEGSATELTVAFEAADGTEAGCLFRYRGAAGKPPAEITEFVVGAIAVTDPWFDEFKARVQASRTAGGGGDPDQA